WHRTKLLARTWSGHTRARFNGKLSVVRKADNSPAICGQEAVLSKLEFRAGVGAFVHVNKCTLAAPHRENGAKLCRLRCKTTRLAVGNILKPTEQTPKPAGRLIGHDAFHLPAGLSDASRAYQTARSPTLSLPFGFRAGSSCRRAYPCRHRIPSRPRT